jgi:acetyltransferase-like isoleucine patch superfamily enzyme
MKPPASEEIPIPSSSRIEVRGLLTVGKGVAIGERVRISCESLILGDGARIEDDVVIEAGEFRLGTGSRIETRCRIGAMRGVADRIRIGDFSFLGHDSKLLVPSAAIGDYTAIQHHGLLNGRKPLVIGHNCWIGQNCVLNAEDDLTIGNNVGIGAYSSVYTHGYFGDILEGSQVFKVAPVVLGDDVWILGSYNVISPGVVIGEKALVLTGSNVTKDVPANHTVGGAPARDMTDRLVPYKPRTIDEKIELVRGFLAELVESGSAGPWETIENGYRVHASTGDYAVVVRAEVGLEQTLPPERPLLLFTGTEGPLPRWQNVTVFSLSSRRYTKWRTAPEVAMISFLKSYRARFVPDDEPVVH